MSNGSLSVVAICLNEEEDLPGFLNSFLRIADEIVIIDDGSSDASMDVALKAGDKVKFICNPRKDSEGFCDQRQKGVIAAKSEWILQVDCDMRLTPELALEIRDAINVDNVVAYRFRLNQYFLNQRVRFGGFQYWNQPWLSRRSATSWTQKVHERIHLAAKAAEIRQLNGRMVHLNDVDFSERMRKNYKYSHLEAERLLNKKNRISIVSGLVNSLWRAFRSYVLMFGFLDGKIGFVWSLYQFTGTMSAYFIAWERANHIPRSVNERIIKESFCGTPNEIHK